MESSGWEIRPAGWILLIILAAALIYLTGVSLKKRSAEHHRQAA